MRALLRALLVLVVALLVGAGLAAFSIASRGLSTRTDPSWIEAALARTMRSWATPSTMRDTKNPVQPSDEVMDEALAHFADHCAGCHGNDGSGQTEVGRSFYPPAPDMRAATTQDLTDGEIFSIIEHGIRLTGMPAWGTGTPEGEHQSWALVHFIRRLPSLTPDDIARMEALNPKSPAQIREEEEIRNFLAGDDPPATGTAPAMPAHKHPRP
jgi:mono/diheme cytochrome c family protein